MPRLRASCKRFLRNLNHPQSLSTLNPPNRLTSKSPFLSAHFFTDSQPLLLDQPHLRQRSVVAGISAPHEGHSIDDSALNELAPRHAAQITNGTHPNNTTGINDESPPPPVASPIPLNTRAQPPCTTNPSIAKTMSIRRTTP